MTKPSKAAYKYKDKLSHELPSLDLPQAHKICCPSCGSATPAENLNIHNGIAKCNDCNSIFSFQQDIDQLSSQTQLKQEILRPEGVEISHFQNELDISVAQPWAPTEIILTSIAPFVIFALAVAIAANFVPSAFTKAFVLAFLTSGIASYIAYFFKRRRHKTYIHIDPYHLHIENRPKKLVRDRSYNVEDIDQVYIQSVGHYHGIHMIVNSHDGQKHIPLIHYVKSRSQAKYIEQEIERQLNIPDRRVPEEAS